MSGRRASYLAFTCAYTYLVIIHDAHPELLQRLRRVERSVCALTLGQERLPMSERIAEAIEHGFRQRLELQPSGVVLQLLDFSLDEHEWSSQCRR